MTTVGAYEAKTHLSRLLNQVEGGDTIIITKHGREVARLVPVTPAAADVDTVINELRTARRTASHGAISVRQMIEDGRR